jgi:hypothetical protein
MSLVHLGFASVLLTFSCFELDMHLLGVCTSVHITRYLMAKAFGVDYKACSYLVPSMRRLLVDSLSAGLYWQRHIHWMMYLL